MRIANTKYVKSISLIITIIFLTIAVAINLPISENKEFDGEKALKIIEEQLSFGTRIPGSDAHEMTANFIISQLKGEGWTTSIQEDEYQNLPVKNIVGMRGIGEPLIILGAHYDTRIYADLDPDPYKRKLPVPGANDGASGVAVLLELARVLPRNIQGQLWLVFFDLEDNGNIEGYDWIIGSRSFVQNLQVIPTVVIIVDMVGDTDLALFIEKNSNEVIAKEIWGIGNELGYAQFSMMSKYRILDDHIPFLEAGIPAVDIIDFAYPYWHTCSDTIDKVSSNSLRVVGETLRIWVRRKLSGSQ